MTPTYEEVLRAYYDCRKNKRNTEGALSFEIDARRNIASLTKDLCTKKYEIGVSRCFVVENPVPREVWAGDFRDRVVHHVLYNRLKETYHKSFSAASCACIPGRGTLYGVKRLERAVRRTTNNWSNPAYYLKMDVSSFFNSISKDILFELMMRRAHDDWTAWLIHKIIYHDPTTNFIFSGCPSKLKLIRPEKSLFTCRKGRGLAIGDLSSQFFANVYMNVLDKVVDHQIKPNGYVRYVDDMVLVDKDKEKLIAAHGMVNEAITQRLSLELNPKKTILQPVSRGVDFVGMVVLPYKTVPRRAIIYKALKAINEASGGEERRHIANSYLGLLTHAKARKERAVICRTMMRYGHSVDFGLAKVFASG